MNYNLAKKLKDAGFPQNSHYYVKEDGIVSDVCIPTLSELIEECRKELDEIVIYITDNLVEVKGVNPTYGLDLSVTGSTIIEAVANLWLELNKNENN